MMQTPTAKEIADYLDEYYLTEADLAAGGGCDVEQVREFAGWRCIPPHTHVMLGGATFSGSFGAFSASADPVKYYHPSVLDWLAKAKLLARTMPLHEIAERMRQDFYREFEDTLDGRDPPWVGMSATDGAAYAWAYVMDGTWGACLRVIDIPSMLAKEYARAVFRDFAGLSVDHALSPDEYGRLSGAVADYDRVAQAFAPHERPLCSRTNEFGPARDRLARAQAALAA